MRLLPAAVFLAGLFGCAPPPYYWIRSVAIGPKLPAFSPTCPMKFIRVSPEELAVKYEKVGVICFTGQPSTEADDDMQAEACRLEGEVIAVEGLCSQGRWRGWRGGHDDGILYGVWREKG